MIIYHKSSDLSLHIESEKKNGKTIGFVPTMGALHEGHMTLIERSLAENDITVCSIFVNPTQFNNKTDFEKYPKTTVQDVQMLEEAGCHILFLPNVEEIYPAGFVSQHFELGELENILEGAYRPGHFQGVCMVVERLLTLVPSTTLFLGKKDYQQCMVIQKLIELKSIPTKLVLCETKREIDGLAMSSRNMRLNPEERMQSRNIFETLRFMKNELGTKPVDEIETLAKQKLELGGFEVDYVRITDDQLQNIEKKKENSKIIGLIAATINGIRLIDNLTLAG
jgi:pantoate--beta-alanine ligase